MADESTPNESEKEDTCQVPYFSSKTPPINPTVNMVMNIPPSNKFADFATRHTWGTCCGFTLCVIVLAPIAIGLRGVPAFERPAAGVESRGIEGAIQDVVARAHWNAYKNSLECEKTGCSEGDKIGDCALRWTPWQSQCPESWFVTNNNRRRLSSFLDDMVHTADLDFANGAVTTLSKRRLTRNATRVHNDGDLKRVTDDDKDSDDRRRLIKAWSCPGWSKGRVPFWVRLKSGMPSEYSTEWSPMRHTAILWFQSSSDMFTAPNEKNAGGIKTVCEAGEQLRGDPTFAGVCRFDGYESTSACCGAESLASAVQSIVGKPLSCDVLPEDVETVKTLLATCFPYKKNIAVAVDTWIPAMESDQGDAFRVLAPHEQWSHIFAEIGASDVPEACVNETWALTLLYEFLLPETWTPGTPVSDTVVLLPLQEDESIVKNSVRDVYGKALEPIIDAHTSDPEIVGASLLSSSGKFQIFNQRILLDMFYGVAAFAIIFLLMWLHCGSLFIAALSYGLIFLSLSLSFFLYQIVLWMPFFTFMNLVCVFVLVGIGADDVFVYVDTWKQSFWCLPSQTPVANRVAWTLRRAAGTMAVTTLTTAGAFFSNVVSPVTSVRLFGVFSGIAVLGNYFLVITILPCLVLIATYGRPGRVERRIFKCHLCKETGSEQRAFEAFLEHKLAPLLYQRKIPLLLVFFTLGCCLVPEALRLSRPTTVNFPLLISHPMEEWAQEGQFQFVGFQSRGESSRMFVEIFFGVELVDTGPRLAPLPEGFGPLSYLPIDVSARASQEYLLVLCEEAKKASWLLDRARVAGSSAESEFNVGCWPMGFKHFAETGTLTQWLAHNDTTIVGCDTFPVEPSVFSECLHAFLHVLEEDGIPIYNFGFDMRTHQLHTVTLQFRANMLWTAEFDKMGAFKKEMDTWAAPLLRQAPTQLNKAWWSTSLGFWSLQKGLDEGAREAAIVSFCIAFACLFLVTRDFVSSLYATVSIVFIVIAVTSCMVWQGWELNINEAVIFALSVGFSVDFVCHLTHSYINAPPYSTCVESCAINATSPECTSSKVIEVKAKTNNQEEENEVKDENAKDENVNDEKVKGEASEIVDTVLNQPQQVISEREFRVRSSLGTVGCSVTMAAVTTTCAGAALTPARVLFYNHFGVYLMLAMVWSWVYAFGFLIPLMGLVGPTGKCIESQRWWKKLKLKG